MGYARKKLVPNRHNKRLRSERVKDRAWKEIKPLLQQFVNQPKTECDKRAYDSAHEAEGALIRIQTSIRKGYLHREEKRHYQCEKCGKWHLTCRPKN